MQRFREASLALQLPLIAAAGSLLVGICVVWLSTASATYLQDNRDADHGEALAKQVAASLADPLQRGDLLYVRAALQRFVDNSLAEAIRIRDVVDLPIGEAGRIKALEGVLYTAPVLVGEDIAGEVQLALDLGSRDSQRQRLLLSLMALVIALSMLVFVGARVFAARVSTGMRALESQLSLPGSADYGEGDSAGSANELDLLRHAVEQLPVDMLRGHAAAPPRASDFRNTVVLFVHLASLARYVDTLSESNLHRYTRRLQQLLLAAAQCYRGELRVTRQFGVLISFSPQRNAGSDALRAASCARLIAQITASLEERTSLSLDVAMALGQCELAPESDDDMYPDLYLQGSIDELRELCLEQEEYPILCATAAVLDDDQLGPVAAVGHREDAGDRADGEILHLSPEQEALVEHQAALIVERIMPRKTDGETVSGS